MRPRIICHMMSSVDGKLHPSRYSKPQGADKRILHAHYDRTAATFAADGWMVGRVTMAEMVKDERPASVLASASAPRVPWINPDRGAMLAIGLDPNGKLHYARPTVGDEHIVAVLGEHVTDAYLAELRDTGVSYVFAGRDGRDLQEGVEALGRELGTRRLLLEGGAAINAAFLKAGLIDELSLLVYPGIDGVAGVQSIIEGPEAARPGYGQSLSFKSVDVLEGGMVWLRYDVTAALHID
ncbi:5-amino-6-(5-phosphoribosylamino)uracil reductase [Azospirillum brasilense]|nr:5-amino-6-(5-phosphoribosylamino)uracil reductase [Azospirillum brasilense]